MEIELKGKEFPLDRHLRSQLRGKGTTAVEKTRSASTLRPNQPELRHDGVVMAGQHTLSADPHLHPASLKSAALALPPPSYTDLAHHGLEAVAPGSRFLLRRFRRNASSIREGYQRLSAQVTKGEPVPPVSEWLLDNYYVIEDAVRKVQGHLLRS